MRATWRSEFTCQRGDQASCYPYVPRFWHLEATRLWKWAAISTWMLIRTNSLPRHDQSSSKTEPRGLNRREYNFMNTDVSYNTLADLPAVTTLQISVPYQRSQFSLLAKPLVTAPRPPVESLAQEAQHTDTLPEQMASLLRQVRQNPQVCRQRQDH